ncbi:MAG TPA: hypothetical protein VF503_00170 [Sphingobium sp.]|uniref:hypothetical protein n=1 Tax=Sphingobium sp. TaxID=1912891 RepID=UPI002ED5A029
MLADSLQMPPIAVYGPGVSGTQKLYYSRIGMQSASAAVTRAPVAVSAVSREQYAPALEGQEMAKQSVQQEASEALARVCAGALVIAVVCGLASLMPGLSKLGYVAVAALLVAAFFGTAASDA